MLGAGNPPHAAFKAWHSASADHATAYDRVRTAHDQARALSEHGPLLSLRQQTLARTMLARRSRRMRWGAAAASAVLLVGAPLAAYGIRAWTMPAPVESPDETFRTGIGQQADVALADGSSVTLDTGSTLKVHVSGATRFVILDGQGWFRVRRADMPLEIRAGGHRFLAGAGSFDVRADRDRVRAFAAAGNLTLVQDGSSVVLASGHLLTVRGSDIIVRSLDDPMRVTGWRTGLLQLDDVTLAEAVDEFNRYRQRPIRIADAHAARLRVSGAFRTTGGSTFAAALAAGFPVRVKQDGDAGIVIASR